MSELRGDNAAADPNNAPASLSHSPTADPVVRNDRSPWRSLLWFYALLGIGHFLVVPLQAMRMVVLLQFNVLQNSLTFFLLEIPGSICLMSILIHATLASLCLTWTVGKLWQRVIVYFLTILIGFMLWTAGYLTIAPLATIFLDPNDAAVMGAQFGWDDVRMASLVVIAAVLPLVLWGLQLPFWITRVAGLRLVGNSGVAHPTTRESLSIGDLMLATAVVGACLALLQIPAHFSTTFQDESLVLLMVALACAAVGATVVTIIALPLAWAFLKPLRWSVAWIVALGISAVLSGLLALLFLFLVKGINWMVLVGITSMVFSYVGGVATGLALLRINGWRLAPRVSSLAK